MKHIVSQVSYSEATDELLGFCGVDGADHKCLDKFTVVVGNGEQGYNAIVNAFSDCKIGSFARAIILNPLHPNLPRLTVLTMPTCNKFNTEFVFHQWQEIERLYEQELEDIIGPLIGHSSDGDSRRRKIMLQLSTDRVSTRYRPIPVDLGFVLSCRREDRDNGYVVHDLCDQDYIHNHKKLLNPLDHASRILMIGEYLVHMNHLQLVYNSFPLLDHGLGINDIERKDRQNWRSVQKITFPKVRDCLRRLMEGEGQEHHPNPALLGTQSYLLIFWYYVEIFCSSIASLTSRIKYAALVCHFLGIWHNYIHRHERLTVRKNFITMETYKDILISCHFAVILICYMRDNFPDQDCHLDLTGSDVLEEFWSKNGQWVGNRHNYNFGDLRRNTSHMIRLEEIRINPNAPDFAKPHPKQESIWHHQYPDGYERANMKAYPAVDSEITAWQEGMEEARALARELGMAPRDDPHESSDESNGDDGGEGPDWF